MKVPLTSQKLNELLTIMREKDTINYVTPTIHLKTGYVITIVIDLYTKTRIFSSVNHPDEDYSLYDEVISFLETLK